MSECGARTRRFVALWIGTMLTTIGVPNAQELEPRSYSPSPAGTTWLAVDGTWFAGGETRVDGAPNPDLQRNARVGITLSIPIVGQQSVKFVYSTGTTTRRGSDFNTFNVTWQLVMF